MPDATLDQLMPLVSSSYHAQGAGWNIPVWKVDQTITDILMPTALFRYYSAIATCCRMDDDEAFAPGEVGLFFHHLYNRTGPTTPTTPPGQCHLPFAFSSDRAS